MPVMIQIRNVPEVIHRKLKARAAEEGLSLSDYILKDLSRLVEQPTMREWVQRLREMPPIKTKETSEQTIRAIRDGR
jgi:plasmid stability protein